MAASYPRHCLVVNLRMQPRNDLEVLLAIAELPLVRHFDLRVPSLLLRLPLLDPLLGRQMLAKLCENVVRQSETLEQWAVLERIQNDMVIGSISRLVCSTPIDRMQLTGRNKARLAGQHEPDQVAEHAPDECST